MPRSSIRIKVVVIIIIRFLGGKTLEFVTSSTMFIRNDKKLMYSSNVTDKEGGSD